MRISLRALQSEQRLAQLQQETQVINDSSSLVAYLYDSYHLPRASEQYR